MKSVYHVRARFTTADLLVDRVLNAVGRGTSTGNRQTALDLARFAAQKARVQTVVIREHDRGNKVIAHFDAEGRDRRIEA